MHKTNHKILAQDADIMDRWKWYFHKLINGSQGGVTWDSFVSDEEINVEYVRRIRRIEVEYALEKMKSK